MTRHTYTEEDAPRNTGSVTRPARFNLRLTCSARARTMKVLAAVREMTEMPQGSTFADVWEDKILPAVEHIVWNAKEAPRGTRQFVLDLFRPLAKEDHVRSRYEELRTRFEPHRFVQPSFEVLAEAMG